MAGYRAHRDAAMAHLKETLHQKPRLNSEDIFHGKTPISGKNAYIFRTPAHFRAKKLCIS